MPPRKSAAKKRKAISTSKNTQAPDFPQKAITEELDPYHRKLSIYIASARDVKINIRSREAVWYGAWNFVLNHHFLYSTEFYIYPQWPVWKLKNDSISSDVSSSTKAQEAQRPLPALATKDDSKLTHPDSPEEDTEEENRDELTSLPLMIKNATDQNQHSSSVEEDYDEVEEDYDEESQDELDFLPMTTKKVTDSDQRKDVPTKGGEASIRPNFKASRTLSKTLGHHAQSSSTRAGKHVAIELARTETESWDDKPTDHPPDLTVTKRGKIPEKRNEGVIRNIAISSKIGRKSATIADHKQTFEPYEHTKKVGSRSRVQTAGRSTNKSEKLVIGLLSEREDDDRSQSGEGDSQSDDMPKNLLPSKASVADASRQTKDLKKIPRRKVGKSQVSNSDESRNDTQEHAQSKATTASIQPTGPQRVLVMPSANDKEPSSVHEDSDDDSHDPKSQWKVPSRLPDFGVLRLTPDGPVPINNVPLLNDAETVLIMEVKRLVDQDHLSITKGLAEAQEDLEVQAAYVFSRGAQTSVVAVAVAGERYVWAILAKNLQMPSFTLSEDEDPTWTPFETEIKPVILVDGWSPEKHISTVEADAEWEDIKLLL